MYRCEATTVGGFVQQLAVAYVQHGYWFYVTGRIKPGKDPATIDQKLIAKYNVDISERERSDRKRRGLANMQYIRYENWFLLLSTHGHHAFKQQERKQIRDCRRHSVKFEGYSISYRRSPITPKGGGDPKWHACVRIDNPTYKQLKSYFLDRAVRRSADSLAQDLARIPYARYAPVRRQLLTILRAANAARMRHNFDRVPTAALKLRRKITSPFETRGEKLDGSFR